MAEKIFAQSESLEISYSFIWKQTELSSDDNDIVPVVLYIHGGGFVGGSRLEYCRPLFADLLQQGFVVVSTDYRLLPETEFVHGQLEDIRDIGTWVRTRMPLELKSRGFKMTCGNIVVIGSSAGALLALLTPKLWDVSPKAVVSIYGATNLHNLPYLHRGPLDKIDIPVPNNRSLVSILNFEAPPSATGKPKSPSEWLTDRTKMGMYVMRAEISTEFLIKGLRRDSDGSLAMPTKGGLTTEEIDAISPLQLCRKIKYPPVYQIMGSIDSCYEISHVHDMAAALGEQGVSHIEHIVEGKDHAFDIGAHTGGEVHQKVMVPAVKWITTQAHS